MNTRLLHPSLEVMNFLNEINQQFPNAISFAPGRPDSRFFEVRDILQTFLDTAIENHINLNDLGQYNQTQGIINEAIVQMLATDEDIQVEARDIILTDGAQEGMVIVIDSMFDKANEVLLVNELAYIGFVGYAGIQGIEIQTIRHTNTGIDLADLESKITALRQQGKYAKILYEVPDFHNPTGVCMPPDKRKKLLTLAEKYNFWIVEDNPYGLFRYIGEKIPTLKALDTQRRVIYLGSFAKTIFPALRLGYIVADQIITIEGKSHRLSQALKKTKSLTTVNSSTLLQSIVQIILAKNNYSLQNYCRAKIEAYHQKRDTLLKALQDNLPADEDWSKNFEWNVPEGGFFLTIRLPFALDDTLLYQCVQNYGVIFCPMYFFAVEPKQHQYSLRLSFSSLSVSEIEEGVNRLAMFFKNTFIASLKMNK